ncbi:LuxR C-terminal-related transcriptional regulator [Dactylosporangium darangshiense]|uniref:LuxR family transcriptional regulator n=1 Tax=Dactylosporangium darangshiense TaxID=579108 RepID=A0ABP8DJL2_9ACTN
MGSIDRAGSDDATSVLRAKLTVPEVVPRALPRRELHDELWSLTDLPVAMITGPAGTGKTQLVAAWAGEAGSGDPVAWLTLDRDDGRQPDRLWRHLLAALRGAGVVLPARLTSGAPADHRTAMDVAAALARWDRPLLLVLDNATWLGPELYAEVDYVVRHAECLRLLLVGRRRPRFPVHRYRLTDELGELPPQDLLLDAEQTRELLALHDVGVTDGELADVMRQTRGWIAGARLCALAMEATPGAGVPNLTEHPHVAEYFTGEIADALTEPQRALMAGVALLDAFTPQLAAAAGGRDPDPDVLDELAEAGAFLERTGGDGPGGAGGSVYRMHPLFAAMLRDRLAPPPPQARAVRLRAARFLAAAGDVPGAVAQAAEAGAWDQAARIVVDDLAAGELILDGPEGRLAGLLSAAPDEPATPEGVVVAAALALARGDHATAERFMARAGAGPAGLGAFAGVDNPVALALSACLVQQSLAYFTADLDRLAATADAAARLLERADRQRRAARPELRVFVLSGRATAALCAGRLAEAAELFAEAALAAAGHRCNALLVYCAEHLAFAEAHRGRLRVAYDAARRALALAETTPAVPGKLDHPVRPHVADATLAWVAAEWYDIHTAWQYLRSAEEGLEAFAGQPQRDTFADTLALVRARLLRAGGELPAALSAVRRAPTGRHPRPWIRSQLALTELRLLIAMGRHQEVRDALDHLDPDLPEVELLGGVAQLAGGDPDRAIECADRVLARFDLPVGVVVDAWLLLAAGVARQGDDERAAEALRTAVEFMAEEGGVRAVYESDVILRRLLREQDMPHLAVEHRADPNRGDPEGVPALSARQADVLRRLAARIPVGEIAAELNVSVTTVRTHIRGILRALEVDEPADAIRRAGELGLL